ncbi:uncharacterized protein TNCV_1266091 [Trichonephila clavipes]|nr:uncharacterized protein TNCV_1266091 [Trichonephila clavipes]
MSSLETRAGSVGNIMNDASVSRGFEESVLALLAFNILIPGVSKITHVHMHDGATCHTLWDSMQNFTEFFDYRVISKGHCPPRSPDLLIPEFFLWGYLKNVGFRNNPHMLDELNILHAISDIKSPTLRKVSINLVKRVRLCVQKNKHYFEHLLWCHHA